jgi:DNA-binding IclR family transcriptional regulator
MSNDSSHPSVTEGRTRMQSVDRVVGVLMCLADSEPELGVTEIATLLGLPKSAVHRVLEALVDSGMIAKERERGKYRLGPRAIELSVAAFGTVDFQSMARPVMESLRDEVGETVTLSMRQNRQRVYVSQVESREDVRMTVDIGRRAPLYAGASGRAILMTFTPAELEEYFEHVDLTPLTDQTVSDQKSLRSILVEDAGRGYTVSLGERDPYAAAIAAPIMSRTGHAFGCVSICGPSTRLTGDRLESCGPALRLATEQISELVGGA